MPSKLTVNTPSSIWFGIITLFPEMFRVLQSGITGRAIQQGILELQIWNPRDFTHDKHQTVDDKPYGGGPGMVMKPQPLKAAIEAAKKAAKCPPTVIFVTPQGQPFNQDAAAHLAAHKAIIFLSGRYEGIDERIIQQEIDEEWSIGDYILTGGELPIMVMIDAISRLLPGVVGDENSIAQDSLTIGRLKYPQYSRPAVFETASVPDVLVSGHHHLIDEWRLKQSLGKTWLKRPDLLDQKSLTEKERVLLAEFISEFLRERTRDGSD